MTDKKISVAKIVCSTSVDGVGLRNSLYVAGCPLRCEGCHNAQYWEIASGTEKTVEEVFAELCQDDCNISILGGEPLMQYDAILELCQMIKDRTAKTIWLWSGYTLDHILKHYPEILRYVNVLVDGPFVRALAEPNLQWRGSTNQTVIDVASIFH